MADGVLDAMALVNKSIKAGKILVACYAEWQSLIIWIALIMISRIKC